MAINGCNLSLEMMDVEKELKEIDENISLMRKRKEILLQKKREVSEFFIVFLYTIPYFEVKEEVITKLGGIR